MMKCLGGRGNMLLMLATYVSLSKSRNKQCNLFARNNLKYHSVTIGNIGFKLCQVKCIEKGGCVGFEYGSQYLTCHLFSDVPRNIEKKAGYTCHLKNPADVPTGPCLEKVCSFTYRCVVILSGKAVCVTDGKQVTPERHIQHQPCDQDWRSVGDLLHDACWKGDLNMVGRTLSEGQLDINRSDRWGPTPLMVAASAGHTDVVKLLISKGFDGSLVANHGYNILHVATCAGHVALVKYILSQQMVGINSTEMCGRTPVIMAAFRGYRDVFDVLAGEGADLALGDTSGMNILHYTCAGGHVEMMKYVLSLGKVDIDSGANNGMTSLIVAARLGKREMFDILISKGCNVSLTTTRGSNILHKACSGGHLEMVEYIVSQDLVDINSRSSMNMTPLLISAELGHGEMFEFLVSRGGNMSMMTEKGKNSLHLLCKFGHTEVVKFVVSMDLLDINAKTNKGETAAMIAKRRGNFEVYDFLLSRGGR